MGSDPHKTIMTRASVASEAEAPMHPAPPQEKVGGAKGLKHARSSTKHGNGIGRTEHKTALPVGRNVISLRLQRPSHLPTHDTSNGDGESSISTTSVEPKKPRRSPGEHGLGQSVGITTGEVDQGKAAHSGVETLINEHNQQQTGTMEDNMHRTESPKGSVEQREGPTFAEVVQRGLTARVEAIRDAEPQERMDIEFLNTGEDEEVPQNGRDAKLPWKVTLAFTQDKPSEAALADALNSWLKFNGLHSKIDIDLAPESPDVRLFIQDDRSYNRLRRINWFRVGNKVARIVAGERPKDVVIIQYLPGMTEEQDIRVALTNHMDIKRILRPVRGEIRLSYAIIFGWWKLEQKVEYIRVKDRNCTLKHELYNPSHISRSRADNAERKSTRISEQHPENRKTTIIWVSRKQKMVDKRVSSNMEVKEKEKEKERNHQGTTSQEETEVTIEDDNINGKLPPTVAPRLPKSNERDMEERTSDTRPTQSIPPTPVLNPQKMNTYSGENGPEEHGEEHQDSNYDKIKERSKEKELQEGIKETHGKGSSSEDHQMNLVETTLL